MSGPVTQTAPDPVELRDLVRDLQYRPGWEAELVDDLDRGQDSRGLTLIITTKGYNSYHPERGETYRVNHYMPVPPAAYNRASWQRWLFEQYLLVEQHECMEYFAIRSNDYDPDDACADCPHPATLHDGRTSECNGGGCAYAAHRFRAETPRMTRPFAPNHGPGNDPYTVRQLTTDEDRRTSFRGDLNPT